MIPVGHHGRLFVMVVADGSYHSLSHAPDILFVEKEMPRGKDQLRFAKADLGPVSAVLNMNALLSCRCRGGIWLGAVFQS